MDIKPDMAAKRAGWGWMMHQCGQPGSRCPRSRSRLQRAALGKPSCPGLLGPLWVRGAWATLPWRPSYRRAACTWARPGGIGGVFRNTEGFLGGSLCNEFISRRALPASACSVSPATPFPPSAQGHLLLPPSVLLIYVPRPLCWVSRSAVQP